MVVGSILLTTVMTMVEVFQRRKSAKKERRLNELKELNGSETLTSGSQKASLSPKSSIDLLSEMGEHYLDHSRDHHSITTCGSASGTHRSSRINENVSFRSVELVLSLASVNVSPLCKTFLDQ